ncbi:AEC family transporter [Aquicoccus porphyridii]|uniref:AEC family transporter n=1 Tax=Aquicoccus porphyridii TaxID=1852029 RepID=A0A5A9ZKX0_9RHOB|nr:AEC family transporter [Aquicoccus porphyridii]KAA0917622.1 AEC family transporter [Aquicoccus porphyridii]RAI55886.1 AEC family transporter [Rhodobacteraceae bacterium AsT-22]
MFEIFLKTLPFFALIGLGFGAGKTRFFTEEATAYLTKFVFYFALSAMLFRFSANLSLTDLIDWRFIGAYLWGSGFVYGIVMAVGFLRGRGLEEASIEAQCAVIGNVGFLGVPMLALLMGQEAVAPVMLVLSMDLIVFGSLVVILITGGRDGRMRLGILRTVGLGLLKNPMIMSIVLGLTWAGLELPMPTPLEEFVSILGAAATPGALFAIGASLATKSAERMVVAGWLSFAKLVLHPLFIAFSALYLFPVDPYPAAVMIACASLPVAGNIFILAQHYGVAPHRVSASILFSTAFSVLTVSIIIAWVMQLY